MFKLPQFLNETAKSYVVVSWKFPQNFLKASWKFYGNFLETTTSYVVVSWVHGMFITDFSFLMMKIFYKFD